MRWIQFYSRSSFVALWQSCLTWPRWHRGWLPRCVGARGFVLFCLLIQFSAVIPGALSPEKSSWTSGEQHQWIYFPLFSHHQWNYWTFWSKVRSPLYMQWNARGEENMPARSCIFAGADFAHLYLGYFFPTCVRCATKWTKFSYWWGKTDFSTSSALCFTETWLCGLLLDSALQLAGSPTRYWVWSGQTRTI